MIMHEIQDKYTVIVRNMNELETEALYELFWVIFPESERVKMDCHLITMSTLGQYIKMVDALRVLQCGINPVAFAKRIKAKGGV